MPIIKTIYKYQNYEFDIDILYSHEKGVKSVELIKKVLNEYPNLKYVFMLLKYLLKQNKYDKTFTGGMNSLTLLNFIYGYILYSKEDINISTSNLLIGFLYFISSTNYELYGISFKNGINLIT